MRAWKAERRGGLRKQIGLTYFANVKQTRERGEIVSSKKAGMICVQRETEQRAKSKRQNSKAEEVLQAAEAEREEDYWWVRAP